ncbi:hypothetical protein CDAR_101921 [Caerostris darwini]|uniref:Uncharacterized protein n=1 Tax=Caerostris darwini TaxID=1538125 RepID=A0AAV4TFL3_9ARAC|nr:hypothetical protein CDAR_101921 [Caerostris darwini]
MNTWELSGGIRGQDTFPESQTKNRSQKNRTSGDTGFIFSVGNRNGSLLNMCKEYKLLVPNSLLLCPGTIQDVLPICSRSTEAYCGITMIVRGCIGLQYYIWPYGHP